MESKPKSVYAYAGEAGIYLGMFLSAISFSFLLSNKLAAASLLAFPLVIALPFFAGWLLNAVAKAEPLYRKFSALWVAGIYSFIFGTLICALLSALYLLFIEPDFFHTYVSNSIKVLKESEAQIPMANASLLESALEQGAIPSPMTFVFSMSWLTCFLGSMLSLPLALMISNSPKLKKSLD